MRKTNTKKAINGNHALSILNKILIVIIVLLVIAIFTLLFFITPMTIDGESMMPTLRNDQRICALKVGYKLDYGDIIIFERPGKSEPPIKRIIGLPGDTIKFDKVKRVWLRNNQQLDEPYTYLAKNNTDYSINYFQESENDLSKILCGVGMTLKSDELFVLGDHRNVSYDSHSYGAIKMSWVKGKYIGKNKI